MPEAPAEQRLNLELTLTVKATDILVRLSGFGTQHIDQYTMRINTMGFNPYDDRSVDIPVLENIDTVSGIMASLIPDKDYHLNIFVFLRGEQSVVVWDYHTDIHTDAAIGQYWSWIKSNGRATAAQTQRAYAAISNRGFTANFSTVVWDDLVWFVEGILKSNNQLFGFNDAEHTTFAYWEGQWWDHTLTASQFSSLQRALRWPYFSWITDPSSPGYLPPGYPRNGYPIRGDKVYGYYFIELAWAANVLADAYSGAYDTMEIVRQYMSVTHSLAINTVAALHISTLVSSFNLTDIATVYSRLAAAVGIKSTGITLYSIVRVFSDKAAPVQIRDNIIMIDKIRLTIDNIIYAQAYMRSLLSVYNTLVSKHSLLVAASVDTGTLSNTNAAAIVLSRILSQHTSLADVSAQAVISKVQALGIQTNTNLLLSYTVDIEADNIHIIDLIINEYNTMHINSTLNKAVAAHSATVQNMHLDAYNILVRAVAAYISIEQIHSLIAMQYLAAVATLLPTTDSALQLTLQHTLGTSLPEAVTVHADIISNFNISSLGLGTPFALQASVSMVQDLIPQLTVGKAPSTSVSGALNTEVQLVGWLSTNDVEISDALASITFVGIAAELFITDGGNISAALISSYSVLTDLTLLIAASTECIAAIQFILNSSLTTRCILPLSSSTSSTFDMLGTLVGYNSFMSAASLSVQYNNAATIFVSRPKYASVTISSCFNLRAAMGSGVENYIYGGILSNLYYGATLRTAAYALCSSNIYSVLGISASSYTQQAANLYASMLSMQISCSASAISYRAASVGGALPVVLSCNAHTLYAIGNNSNMTVAYSATFSSLDCILKILTTQYISVYTVFNNISTGVLLNMTPIHFNHSLISVEDLSVATMQLMNNTPVAKAYMQAYSNILGAMTIGASVKELINLQLSESISLAFEIHGWEYPIISLTDMLVPQALVVEQYAACMQIDPYEAAVHTAINIAATAIITAYKYSYLAVDSIDNLQSAIQLYCIIGWLRPIQFNTELYVQQTLYAAQKEYVLEVL